LRRRLPLAIFASTIAAGWVRADRRRRGGAPAVADRQIPTSLWSTGLGRALLPSGRGAGWL